MKYQHPWWLPEAHSQTIAAAKLAGKPALRYYRTRWDTPDGDFIDLDFTEPEEKRHGFREMWVLFHGLEGSSQSHYCLALMDTARKAGVLGVVVHFRGCSGELNLMPRAYHSGDSDELNWVLPRMRSAYPKLGMVNAIGVSLGGNVLLKWLGEQGESAGRHVDRAVAVSAPVNLGAGAESLAKGFNLVYTRMFLNTLIPKSLAKIRQHPGLADPEHIRSCQNFFDFDNRVTAPWHGFKDAQDYYTRSSALNFLGGIQVPTLMLNAMNDPFMPGQHLPSPLALPKAVRALFTEHGGHVGFATGRGPRLQLNWLPTTCKAFFEEPEAFDGR